MHEGLPQTAEEFLEELEVLSILPSERARREGRFRKCSVGRLGKRIEEKHRDDKDREEDVEVGEDSGSPSACTDVDWILEQGLLPEIGDSTEGSTISSDCDAGRELVMPTLERMVDFVPRMSEDGWWMRMMERRTWEN